MALFVHAIRKSYHGISVLHSKSLEVSAGEILFVKGPSGCGKSTLLRCIANLEARDEGRLNLEGYDCSKIGPAQWRTLVMYVPQARTRVDGTPTEMFECAKNFDSRHRPLPTGITKMKERSMEDIALSIGLDAETITKPWQELSGGQAQRAALAIALALTPKVLLLDEPTSACDQLSTMLVEEAIKKSGIGTIWVSHDETQPTRVGGNILSFE